jgi:hypothetical protein
MIDTKDFIINIVETAINDEEPNQTPANGKSAKEKDLDIDWIINHALQVKFDKEHSSTKLVLRILMLVDSRHARWRHGYSRHLCDRFFTFKFSSSTDSPLSLSLSSCH